MPNFPGGDWTAPSPTDGIATSRRTWTATVDVGSACGVRSAADCDRYGQEADRPPAGRGAGHSRHLAGDLADHFGHSAHRLAAQRRRRATALSLPHLRLLLHRRLQRQQSRRSRSGPPASAMVLLLVVCLPLALYLRFATAGSPPMSRASRSSRCSCPRSSSPTRSSACSARTARSICC